MKTNTTSALLVLRISLFLFMMVWAVQKLVRPEVYQSIFGHFYGQQFGTTLIYGIGSIQILILLAFVFGVFRTASYGLVTVMNLVTLLVSYKQILAPYEGNTNQLFAASIVIAGASIALFLLRDEDNAMTVESMGNRYGITH